jgi:hypothetical protein
MLIWRVYGSVDGSKTMARNNLLKLASFYHSDITDLISSDELTQKVQNDLFLTQQHSISLVSADVMH